MKVKQITMIMSMLIGLLFSGCNNDIFIDAQPLPSSSEITVEGDGGSWSTIIPRDGLTSIKMYNPYRDTDGYVTYYDRNNNSINSDCPADELGAIVLENPAQYYVISFYGRKLSIDSYYNCYPTDYIILLLEYDYSGTKEIRVTFTEGKPLNFVTIPIGEMTVEEDIEAISHRTSFTNNSSLTQTFEVYPFINCNCSHIVIPDESWANKYEVNDMEIPTYTGEEWELHGNYQIRLGERRTFSPSGYVYDKISVDVPPYKKAIVNYTLHYSRATQAGKFYINNVVFDQEYEMGYQSVAIYATRYDYTVDYE